MYRTCSKKVREREMHLLNAIMFGAKKSFNLSHSVCGGLLNWIIQVILW